MLRIAVCDDDGRERGAILALLEQYIASKGLAARIRSFAGANALISAVEDDEAFDLYLLDVLMPGMDGIGLGLALRKLDTDGLIVYLTSARDFAVESYEVGAFHYLIKPIREETLYPVLERAVSALAKRRSPAVHIRTRCGTIQLLTDEIYYAELKDRVVRYACKSGSVDSTYVRGAFSDAVAPLLRNGDFFLCGNSIAINLFHIAQMDRTGATLSTGQRLELPKAACAALRIAWSDYWMGGSRK